MKEQKREQEWEERARLIDEHEATQHRSKAEEAKRQKEKRLKEDQYLDNAELLRVKRTQKEEYEAEERARAREREADLVKDMEKKEVHTCKQRANRNPKC